MLASLFRACRRCVVPAPFVFVLLVLALWVGLLPPTAAFARESISTEVDIAARDLPPEAHRVIEQILAGGPFRYRKDGTVFGNRERKLPRQARGYYTEYTVRTPGERDRGARRIIAGGEPPGVQGEFWYTDDHYRTFRRIRELRMPQAMPGDKGKQ